MGDRSHRGSAPNVKVSSRDVNASGLGVTAGETALTAASAWMVTRRGAKAEKRDDVNADAAALIAGAWENGLVSVSSQIEPLRRRERSDYLNRDGNPIRLSFSRVRTGTLPSETKRAGC
jgi:hypothetical protein